MLCLKTGWKTLSYIKITFFVVNFIFIVESHLLFDFISRKSIHFAEALSSAFKLAFFCANVSTKKKMKNVLSIADFIVKSCLCHVKYFFVKLWIFSIFWIRLKYRAITSCDLGSYDNHHFVLQSEKLDK
ncbi:hypothetical protein DRJ22_05060 [Candidatus Woesearchaeota archaeon]|nr:MAG: hypothetical protein DRJ22_05060 [Candidatus Woesearchaeota archaeon]